MRAQKWRGPPPRDAAGDPRIRHSLAGVDDRNLIPTTTRLQELPSKATLARRWPSLRLNRFTGAWRDDATGARGEDRQSLLAFLEEGAQ